MKTNLLKQLRIQKSKQRISLMKAGWRKKASLLLCVALLWSADFQCKMCAYAALTNLAVGATFTTMDASSVTVNSGSMTDGDTETNGLNWDQTNGAQSHLRITLTAQQNIGSVIFTLKSTGSGDYIGRAFLYAGNDATLPNLCKPCNDGNEITTMGAVNCLAQASRYLHLIWNPPDSNEQIRLSEIFVYAQPELAQQYKTLQTVSGSWSKNEINSVVGTTVYSARTQGTPTIGSFGGGEGILKVQLPWRIASTTQLMINTLGTELPFNFKTSIGTNSMQNCQMSSPTTIFSAVVEGACNNNADNFFIVATSTYLNMQTWAIYETNACSVGFSATMDQPNNSVSYTIGTIAQDYTYTVTHEPIWCSFAGATALELYSDQAMTVPFSDAAITTDGTKVTVFTSDVNYAGSTLIVYVTNPVYNMFQNGKAPPVTLTVSFAPVDPCLSTIFVPADTAPAFTISLDILSTAFYIEMDNQVAQTAGNPQQCGPRTLLVKDSITYLPVPYLTVTDLPAETFFTMNLDTVNILPGTLNYLVDVSLTNFPSVTMYSLPVAITYVCPVAPSVIVASTPSLASPFIYDLSNAITQTESVPSVTIAPNQCSGYTIDSSAVYDQSNSQVTQVNWSIANSDISILIDTSLWPSLHNQVLTYTTKLVMLDQNSVSSLPEVVHNFQIQFAYSTASIVNDCPSTTMDTAPWDTSPVQYAVGNPIFQVPFTANSDFYGRLYNDLTFCGPRLIEFKYQGTEKDVTFLTMSTLIDNIEVSTIDLNDIGTHLIDVRVSLQNHPTVIYDITLWSVTVSCPVDQAFLPLISVTISQPMPQNSFTYDASLGQTLAGDLAIAQPNTACASIIQTTIQEVESGELADIFSIDTIVNTFSLFVDSSKLKSFGVVQYKQFVLVSPPNELFEVAEFSVDFTRPKQKLNQNAYFEPELTSMIQVIKEQQDSVSWTFPFPQVYDADGTINSAIKLGVDLKQVSSFMRFENNQLIIDNLDSPSIQKRQYTITVSLTKNGSEVFSRNIVVIMRDGRFQIVDTIEDQIQESPMNMDEVIEPDLEDDLSEIQRMVVNWRQDSMIKVAAMRKAGKLSEGAFPKIRYQLFSQDGLVHFSFDREMAVLPNNRMLTEGYVYIDGQKQPVLEIEVIPNTDSDPAQLGFRWTVEEFLERSIKFKLYFENAKALSSGSSPDMLRVTFWDPFMFSDRKSLPIVVDERQKTRQLQTLDRNEDEDDSSTEYIQRAIPGQIPLNGFDQMIMESLSTASTTSQVAIYASLSVNFFLGASLNQVWSMISTQQLMVMTPMLLIQMPANANMLFKQIMQIAAFDVYDTTDGILKAFDIEETEPVDVKFESVGFESQYFMVNMGTMAIFYAIYFCQLAFAFCLRPFRNSKKKKFRKLRQKMVRKTMWGSFITLTNETYQIVIVGVFINYRILEYGTLGYASMSVLCILIFLTVVGLPAIFLLILWSNFDKLDTAEYRQNYGVYYEDLNLAAGKRILLQPAFYLVRRTLLALAIVYVKEYLFWQLLILTATIMFSILILTTRVHKSRSQQKLEYFNESMLLLLLYSIHCFTPWVSDVNFRFNIGYATISIVCIHLVTNIFIMIRATIKNSNKQLKFYCIKKQFKRDRSELQQRLASTKEIRLQKRKQKRCDESVSLYSESESQFSSLYSFEPSSSQWSSLQSSSLQSSSLRSSSSLYSSSYWSSSQSSSRQSSSQQSSSLSSDISRRTPKRKRVLIDRQPDRQPERQPERQPIRFSVETKETVNQPFASQKKEPTREQMNICLQPQVVESYAKFAQKVKEMVNQTNCQFTDTTIPKKPQRRPIQQNSIQQVYKQLGMSFDDSQENPHFSQPLQQVLEQAPKQNLIQFSDQISDDDVDYDFAHKEAQRALKVANQVMAPSLPQRRTQFNQIGAEQASVMIRPSLLIDEKLERYPRRRPIAHTSATMGAAQSITSYIPEEEFKISPQDLDYLEQAERINKRDYYNEPEQQSTQEQDQRLNRWQQLLQRKSHF